MAWILVVMLLIALDQGVKYIIVQNLSYGEFIPVINNFFYITFWKNKGAAWGILQNNRAFLIGVTLIALILLVYLLKKSESKLSRYSIIMIIGGALGNFVDRAFKDGGVVDFLLFRFGTYEFPAFNVADSLIVCGTILLVIATLLEGAREKKKIEVEESEKCN